MVFQHELFVGTLVNRLSIMLMTQIFEGKNLDVNTCALWQWLSHLTYQNVKLCVPNVHQNVKT